MSSALARLAASCLVCLASTDGVAEERIPLAEVDGHTIYVDEVEGALAFRIYKHRLDIYSLLKSEAEQRIERQLLEAEARERGKTVEAMLAEVEAADRGVTQEETEEQIDRYLEENPPDPSAGPEKIRERVRHYLAERERLARRIAFMDGLREAAGARVLLEPPPRPRTRFELADAPVRGPDDAPVVLVHFANFASRNGSRSAARIARLAAAFPGQIRRAHVTLLDDRDEAGLHAARLAAAVAVRRPEAFWPLHDALFAREGKLDPARIDAVALELGVPASLIEEAAEDARWLGAVKLEIDRAIRAGVPREPGLFVNGLFVSGLAPYDDLATLVADELESRAQAR